MQLLIKATFSGFLQWRLYTGLTVYRYDLILKLSRQQRKQVYTMKDTYMSNVLNQLYTNVTNIYVCRTYIVSAYAIFFSLIHV